MKGNAIIRLSPRGGAVGRVHDTRGVVKLVGFDRKAPDALVVVLDPGAGSPLGAVSLATGKIATLPYDEKSSEEQRVLAQARGQDRVYGSTKVYLKTETKQGLSRALEWTDVYVQRADGPPKNISACDGVNCVQPALSPDGRSVVFVKADD